MKPLKLIKKDERRQMEISNYKRFHQIINEDFIEIFLGHTF